MERSSGLPPEQDQVLALYQRHRIRHGYGLTFSTFSHELRDHPPSELRQTLNRMVQTGLLTVWPEVDDFYILTRDGERFFNPLA